MRLFLILLCFVTTLRTAHAASDNNVMKTCNCEFQSCIDITETELLDGTTEAPEITLTGISAIKKFKHPTHGDKKSIILILDKAVCFHGTLSMPDGPPEEYELPNTTYIQLILDDTDDVERFSRDHKGERFIVTGTITYGISAWHITPILLDVNGFQNASNVH